MTRSAHGRGRPWPALVLLALLLYLVAVPLAFLLVASLKPTGLPFDPGWVTEHFGRLSPDRPVGSIRGRAC